MICRSVLPTITGILLVFFYVIKLTVCIRWLSVASVAIRSEEMCNSLKGLIKRQRKICRANLHIMGSVTEGALKSLTECQFQFRNRRWNCSLVKPHNMFGNAIAKGTRESAFLHAISAAGVAHAVTRACANGRLQSCGCDRSIRGQTESGFRWAGCSDNIAYGKTFSKRFIDARERKRGKRAKRALVNLHNNNAGRLAIENGMRKICKCHGVSGSCELRTCWRGMPSFREVGKVIKEKFDGATEVVERVIGNRKQLVPRNSKFKPHTTSDLVYLVKSPDFCIYNNNSGTLGTAGRHCNKTSKAIDGCDLLCCNRGFITEQKIIKERCHCKFHWCCHVQCDECTQHSLEHTCL